MISCGNKMKKEALIHWERKTWSVPGNIVHVHHKQEKGWTITGHNAETDLL